MDVQAFDQKYNTHYSNFFTQEGLPTIVLLFDAHFKEKQVQFDAIRRRIDSYLRQPNDLSSREIVEFFSPKEFEKMGDMVLVCTQTFLKEQEINPDTIDDQTVQAIMKINDLFTEWHSYYSSNHTHITELYAALLAAKK